MTNEEVAAFLGNCLHAFTEGATDAGRRTLVFQASQRGLMHSGEASDLYIWACRELLDVGLPEGWPELSTSQKSSFLLWFSGIVFDCNAMLESERLHMAGVYYMANGTQPLFARCALRRAFALRKSEGRWSPAIDSLTQLSVAYDEINRRIRALSLLGMACRLSDIHEVEPRVRDACLRLSAVACAWEGRMGPAIERLDAAAPFSLTVYGATPMKVEIAWTNAICSQAFNSTWDRSSLFDIMCQVLTDLKADVEPQKRFTEIDMLQHGLARSLHSHLAVLSNRLAAKLAMELPELGLRGEDRCIILNNYGNALLRIGWNAHAISPFDLVRSIATQVEDVEDRDKSEYQLIHALGGIGFAHYNMARGEPTDSAENAALERAAAAFDAAELVRNVVGSRAWFEGRIWVVAGLVDAKLGRLDAAWRHFSMGLLAGIDTWGSIPDGASLDAFFNPDSDIREKLTEGLEELSANHAAVIFGKAALHAVHRESLPEVSISGSRQYIRMRSGVHRALVRCLTAVGRHNEAEQAFALLKDDAWGLYARIWAVPVDVESSVALTQAERLGIQRSGLPRVLTEIAACGAANHTTTSALATALKCLDECIGAELDAQKVARDQRRRQGERVSVAAGDARIRYVVSPNRTSITVELQSGIFLEQSAIKFDKLSELSYSLRQACRQHSMFQTTIAANAAWQLDQALIAPIRHLLVGIKHLWIEVDSPLEGVPFVMLFDGVNHLVDCFSIAYLSLSIQERPVVETPPHEPVITVFACSELPDAELPGAAAEAKAIASTMTLSKHPVSVRTIAHAECTVARFVEQLRRPGQGQSAIHLATHADFNATSDLMSVLALADGNLSISRLRQTLEPHVLDLGVFVLSACGTARQDMDVEGFSGTLLRSGVGTVVSTLWESLDSSAPVFFKEFYTDCNNYGSPRQVAQALRHAQRAVRASSSVGLDHPAHWAPYVVICSHMS